MKLKHLLRGVVLFLPAVVGAAGVAVFAAAFLVPSVTAALGMKGILAVATLAGGGTVGFATLRRRLRRLSGEVFAARNLTEEN
ncbi:hypothetical protein ACFO0N_09100 [Halobium salinum]|uniref:Uncharacterized protein n=1 Tax=Halobium salinum TaxID=1364940 RepID=A0ABD5PBJ7_9EURY|nr:hypothetical protein [Halobium salinum]